MSDSGTKKFPKIKIGYRVGSLVVSEATERRKSGYTVWRCQCDCGGEILLDTRCLQRQTVRDCGCRSVMRAGQRDLRGQQFGRLTVLYPTGEKSKDGCLVWHCRCVCGRECDAPGSQLTGGYKKSCGCLGHPPLKKLSGLRFGLLTVLGYAGKWSGKHYWHCSCDCGRDVVVAQTNLQSGKTKSCGCLRHEICRENLQLIEGTSVKLLEAYYNKLPKSNTSGYVGVYQNKKSGKWNAQIGFKGKTYFLGSYDRKEDAVKARARGTEMHDQFLEWYYKTHPSKLKN